MEEMPKSRLRGNDVKSVRLKRGYLEDQSGRATSGTNRTRREPDAECGYETKGTETLSLHP